MTTSSRIAHRSGTGGCPGLPVADRRTLRRAMAFTLSTAAAAAWSGTCRAQDVGFPPVASGYDQQLGVTVRTRDRSLYAAPGVQIGGIVIRPELDQSVGYESNPTASPTPTGSPIIHTAGSAAVSTLWPTDSLAAQIGVDNYYYPSLSGVNYTDWNVGLGGSALVAGNTLSAAYAHQFYHELGASIGTVRSETPTADHTDTMQLSYGVNLYRITLTPDASFSAYRYGTATEAGNQVQQKYLDRNVSTGGLTARYTLNDVGGLLVVVRAIDAHYLHGLPGQPTNNSRSYMALTGIDYQAESPWRYRLLVGAEVSTFSAAEYSAHTTPVVEADVTWTPTRLTTITATARRAIADPLAAGTNGNISTQANLQVDRELLRNVILTARGGVQYAQFLTSGTQIAFDFGLGANWLINRHLSLAVDYGFNHNSAATGFLTSNQFNQPDTAGFTQHSINLTLKLAL